MLGVSPTAPAVSEIRGFKSRSFLNNQLNGILRQTSTVDSNPYSNRHNFDLLVVWFIEYDCGHLVECGSVINGEGCVIDGDMDLMMVSSAVVLSLVSILLNPGSVPGIATSIVGIMGASSNACLAACSSISRCFVSG